MRWGKKLAQAAVPVIKKALRGNSLEKCFRLAFAILAPLTECIAKIHIDTEASYKDKWLNCYVAACQEFDNVAIAVGASFAGMAAASYMRCRNRRFDDINSYCSSWWRHNMHVSR